MSVSGSIARHARGSDPIAWSTAALLRQGMPHDEVRALLLADRPEIVHRHLELHRERLGELLCDDLNQVDRIERLLTARR